MGRVEVQGFHLRGPDCDHMGTLTPSNDGSRPEEATQNQISTPFVAPGSDLTSGLGFLESALAGARARPRTLSRPARWCSHRSRRMDCRRGDAALVRWGRAGPVREGHDESDMDGCLVRSGGTVGVRVVDRLGCFRAPGRHGHRPGRDPIDVQRGRPGDRRGRGLRRPAPDFAGDNGRVRVARERQLERAP